MKESSGVKGDFYDRKDELAELHEELQQLDKMFERFDENYQSLKRNKKTIEGNIKKMGNIGIDGLDKLREQLKSFKNEVSNLYTDSQDTKEQLEEI